MTDHIKIPYIEYGGYRWAALAYYAKDHEFTSEEQAKCVDQKYSFKGGHRVRIFRLRKQVYWKIPPTTLDISEVPLRRVQV